MPKAQNNAPKLYAFRNEAARMKRTDCTKRVWEKERPMLSEVLRHKGFKRNLYPNRCLPPHGFANIGGMLHLLQIVERKAPPAGHRRRYASEWTVNGRLPVGVTNKGDQVRQRKFKNPIVHTPKKRGASASASLPPPPPPTPAVRQSKRLASKSLKY